MRQSAESCGEMAAASFAAITEASVPPAFSALGHDLKRPRLEVVKDLLQPRDVPLDHVLYGASVAGHNRSSSADTYKSALT